MKIALLSSAASIHTVRWANGLHAAGHQVHVVSQHPEVEAFASGVQVHLLPFRGVAGYFLMVPRVRHLLRQLRPDIVNAHYASGYATTARLVRYRPWLLSVWGSDVYDFPEKSALHRWLVRGNLQSAEAVASTSECMARRTSLIALPKHLFVTPFGVDESLFKPALTDGKKGNLVIGTVKTLSTKYGIDVLIHAFALIAKELGASIKLSLEITGSGPEEAVLKELVVQLGIASAVTFHGAVPHARVPEMLQRLDIFVALSRDDSESFGVAAVEAAACGLPVVVSDAEGLAEVTRDGVTGFVVPRNNPKAAAIALARLVRDAKLRQAFGLAGREHVLTNYTWSQSLDKMIAVYENIASKRKVAFE